MSGYTYCYELTLAAKLPFKVTLLTNFLTQVLSMAADEFRN